MMHYSISLSRHALAARTHQRYAPVPGTQTPSPDVCCHAHPRVHLHLCSRGTTRRNYERFDLAPGQHPLHANIPQLGSPAPSPLPYRHGARWCGLAFQQKTHCPAQYVATSPAAIRTRAQSCGAHLGCA